MYYYYCRLMKHCSKHRLIQKSHYYLKIEDCYHNHCGQFLVWNNMNCREPEVCTRMTPKYSKSETLNSFNVVDGRRIFVL